MLKFWTFHVNLLWRTKKLNQFICYNTRVSFNCKYDRQINTWKSNDVYNLRFSFSEKYLFIENAMVIYKALQIITCQRLNICRQVLFTEVEMLDIIVYKTSCFFTRYLFAWILWSKIHFHEIIRHSWIRVVIIYLK